MLTRFSKLKVVWGLQKCSVNVHHLDCFIIFIFRCSCAHLPPNSLVNFFSCLLGPKTESCNICEKRTYTNFHVGFQMNKNEGRKCVYWYITPIHTNGCTIFVKTLTAIRQNPTTFTKCDVILILTLTLQIILTCHTHTHKGWHRKIKMIKLKNKLTFFIHLVFRLLGRTFFTHKIIHDLRIENIWNILNYGPDASPG